MVLQQCSEIDDFLLQLHVLRLNLRDVIDCEPECGRFAHLGLLSSQQQFQVLDSVVDRAPVLLLDQVVSGTTFASWP